MALVSCRLWPVLRGRPLVFGLEHLVERLMAGIRLHKEGPRRV
jgi:hypothetical protein